jgi:tetratricopeptide (TPR) repeat protein
VIRKLRKIQNETGLIKPLGLQRRYGEKTTVYAFSRQFYHNYFEGQLQYEEQVELHSRIAEKLKKKFEQSDSPYEKAQLVGYIAAHSKEADNPEIAESVLAESAGLLGGADIDALAQKLGLSIDLSAMEEIETSISSGEVNGIGGEGDALNSIEAPIDIGLPFNMLRHRVATFHNLGKLSEAYQETKRHLKFGDRVYSKREMIMLLVMQAKTLIDLRELENAESVLDKAKKLAGDSPDEQVKCLLMNTEAIILDEKGDNGKAQEVLQEAAKLAFTLQPELKLMTLANIGRLIEEKDPELAEKYYDASEKLRGELSLSGLIIRN